MRKLTVICCFHFVLIFLFFSLISPAQMIINSGPEVTPIDMVECILGEGVQYANVTFQGADVSRGIFSNGYLTNIGIDKGVFLTSGAGYIIPGPNNSTSAGVSNGLGGHPIFGPTFDACVLEFDIIPESDTLKLTYVFGSEEYSEWVGATFNDVFGLFVTGPNPLGGYYNDKNIAIVPGTANTNVAINNVNNGYAVGNVVPTGPCTNCEFFLDNTGGLTIQYDGFTTVLTAWLLVNPCEEYHLKLGVADAGDHIYDSGVLIAENSITSPKIEVYAQLSPPDISNTMIEGGVEADIIFKLPQPAIGPLTVYFEVTGTADPSAYQPGDFEEEIPTEITFEEGEDSAAFHVNPVYDAIIEGEETLVLIVENTLGCIFKYDTVILTIEDYTEMVALTSPNSMICSSQEINLWVQVYNGYPPYTYLWEPGGFTTDSITVAPDSATTYYVTYTDQFLESGMDSIMIHVLPHNVDILEFSFEAEINPQFSEDIIGVIFEDSISLILPIGSNPENLIATFNLQESAYASANGEIQESGITVNDFTNPVIYKVITPWGCMKDWTVAAHVLTANNEVVEDQISIYPNPAKDNITISNAQGNKLTVLNSLGAVVLERNIDEKKLILDVADFVEGVYYLQFINNEYWFVEKVVIDK